LRRLDLDWIWWFVTPGNPLKDTRDLPPIGVRVDAARRLAAHPRIVVTAAETRLGSPYTYDLLATLTQRCPGVRFVWIMGADSFAGFHRWKRWRDIANTVPIAVVDRPGFTLCTAQTRAGTTLRSRRLGEADATALATAAPPAYVFLHGPRSRLSSTVLRARPERAATTNLSP
jgi:nicotinate-nucleotide adenylyltransferase